MQPNLKLRLGLALAGAACVLCGPVPAASGAPPACSLNWVGHGTTGSFSDANNWAEAGTNLARAPTSTDVLCIGPGFTTTEPTIAGSLTVAGVQAASPVGIQQFVTLSLTDTADASVFNGIDSAGGSIDDAGPVTIAGIANWGPDANGNGGKLSGSGGTTDFTGTVNFTASAEIGTGHKLQTDGTGNWTGRQITFDAGAGWTNNGTFNMSPVSSNTGIYWTSGSGGELYNSPTGKLLDNLAPAGGATTATVPIGMPLRNDGTVQSTVAGSTLSFSNASGTSHGNFGGSGPGTVFISAAFDVDSGATFDHLEIQNGALLTLAGANISGGSVTLDIPYGYCCVSSRLGGPGRITIHGTLTSWGGTLDGAGTVDVAADGTLLVPDGLSVGSGTQLLTEGASNLDRPAANGNPEGGGSISFKGTASWTNSGPLLFGAGSSVQSDAGCPQFQTCGSVPPYGTFTNSGTITEVPQPQARFADIGMPMVNTGTIVGDTAKPVNMLITGILTYTAGGPQTLWIVNSGTITGAQLTNVELGGGAVVHSSGLRGVNVLPGAVADAYDSGVGAQDPSCLCGGGTLGGDGTLRLFGANTFDGTMQDGGTTILMPGATLTVASGTSLADSRLLETEGNTTIPGSGFMSMKGNSAWINAGTLTIDQGSIIAGNVTPTGSPEPVLYNTGTISEVNGDTGWIGTVFNDGTISIPRGQLDLDALSETSDAVVNVGVGGTTAQSGYGVLNLGPRSYTYGQEFWGLAGTLRLTLDPGYAPADGSKYDVVTGAPTNNPGSSPVSAFEALSVANAPAGTTFTGATATNPAAALLASPLELTAHVAAPAAPSSAPAAPAAAQTAVGAPAAPAARVFAPPSRDPRVRAILRRLHARKHRHRRHYRSARHSVRVMPRRRAA